MSSTNKPTLRKSHSSFRGDRAGGGGHHHHDHGGEHTHDASDHLPSLQYQNDESEVWRAHVLMDHYRHRGQFWNTGKHQELVRYLLTALVGITQGCVAYFTNLLSNYFIDQKFETVYGLLEEGHIFYAYFRFASTQLFFAALASAFVWIEPISAGSGIPEVKCYLNGIDLPNVGAPLTLVCKVLGVICSVSAGLPVGKEGPMVHSGAVVATTVSSGRTRNDREVRDFVACGAASGVCTAFSAPIGGILFSLEEGASYWGPSLTWRTFFCSMVAFTTLLMLNTIGSAFGKVGFNKLFSFGNFKYEGAESSFAVFELFVFIAIGAFGGLIGAVFNNTNERITKWRLKNVNHSKSRRYMEVIALSLIVSTVMFALPLVWTKCTPLPEDPTGQEAEMIKDLVAFRCIPGEEYNEMASLLFTEPGVAIRQLFHLHSHAFSHSVLFLFFFAYISLAVVVYGIAIPSGLFVPSLLSGAAFGRLLGNLAHELYPTSLAYSNTYALVGAAAVLGGMARMTISLTVILLECTGSEQFVLPLMLTLMTARIVGGFFNDDLYHIHIHFKKGVYFLEHELQNIPKHHSLTAYQVMGDDVVFFRPVEKVGTVIDILQSCKHSSFPVVDPDDNSVLFGTIGRNALCVLLRERVFGNPATTSNTDLLNGSSNGILSNYLEHDGNRYIPLVEWETVEGSYPKFPKVEDIRLNNPGERECYVDLRPYANTSPISVHEAASVNRAYEIFRTLGLRFLPVVNSHNQVVGTITRTDLAPDQIAHAMLDNKKKHN